MLTKIFLLITTLMYAVRGVMLLLVPGQLYGAFGVTLTTAGLWDAHYASGMQFVLAAVNWLAFRGRSRKLRETVYAVDSFVDFYGCLWALQATMSGLFGSFGWVAVAQHGLSSLIFLSLWVGVQRKQREQMEPAEVTV